MKKILYIILATLLSCFSVQAQNTEGTDFWLTFGKNGMGSIVGPDMILQIRIVGGNIKTTGTIYFTHSNENINFVIEPYEIYDYILNTTQMGAVYNVVMGKTNFSIHINASYPVSVYAFKYMPNISYDATNVLPVDALGTEYYQISYMPLVGFFNIEGDAYAVVATQNNTQIYHNGVPIPEGSLDAGEVYYRTLETDMTGSYITSNKPVAFFAVNQAARIPFENTGGASHVFQQLASVNTWGRTFFVPVSITEKNIVRIVASHNNTDITQTGGTIRYGVPGAQTNLTNLQAGQFVELDIHINDNGCHIQANRPVGVCSYFTVPPYSISGSMPAQCWIPGIEQKISSVKLAAFKIPIFPQIHYALIVTSTETKNNTKVSIGGGTPSNLSGGIWIDNDIGESFYNMPLTDENTSYLFTNPNGLIIYVYGKRTAGSGTYFYLAGSAMRDLDAAFYANDIHFQDLKENPFCAGVVDFRAEIEGLHPSAGSLEWYVDGEYQPTLDDQQTWSKTFTPGEYEIRMWVRFENNDTISKIGTLKIISCNQSAEFYANNIHHSELANHTICNKTGKVDFRAEIEGLSQEQGSLKWYVDDVEQTAAQNQQTWSKTFETGTYQIKMWVRYDSGEEETITSTLKVEIFFIKIQNVRH